MVWFGWFRIWVPASLEIEIAPTPPSASANRVKLFSLPSAPAVPATVVPLIPMIATGVLNAMEPSPSLATPPLTKENVPCTTSVVDLPNPASGS